MSLLPQAAQRWLVLQAGTESPTADYYVHPRAAQLGAQVLTRNILGQDPAPADFEPGVRVIIVRYLNGAWAQALRRHRHHLAELVYLMDDDLLDPDAWSGLPWAYRWKLYRLAAAHKRTLRELGATLWVSSPALQQRYAGLNPQLTPPMPLIGDRPRAARPGPAEDEANPAMVRLFYHGSASHAQELAWLRPVAAAALAACPTLHLELIGDLRVNALYRGLPRTRVLHPMRWSSYLAHCRDLSGHLGLAPLLPSRVNQVRSATRAFDIARCGATGLYTQGGPYDACIRHGHNGLLLRNDPEVWVEAVVALVRNAPERLALINAAQTLLA